MRIMYDSTTPSAIPSSAVMVAGYINGKYAWTEEDWARFPHAVKIRIDVNGTHPYESDVLDVERGDATPAMAEAWVKERQHRGWWSAVYCDRSTWPAVKAACSGLKTVYWIADWTSSPHLLPGSVATQYDSGTGFDMSVAEDAWFRHTAPGWQP